jgi:hypothetical protein
MRFVIGGVAGAMWLLLAISIGWPFLLGSAIGSTLVGLALLDARRRRRHRWAVKLTSPAATFRAEDKGRSLTLRDGHYRVIDVVSPTEVRIRNEP